MEALADRLNVVIYLVAIIGVLAAAAVILSAWCAVMLGRVLRGETPWQRQVTAKVFPEPAAPTVAPPMLAPVQLAPMSPIFHADDGRGSSPSEEPPEFGATTRPTMWMRGRR